MTDSIPTVGDHRETIRATVADLVREGVAPLVLKYMSKSPAVERWEDYKVMRPDEATVNGWFGNGQVRNVGAICGRVSRGLAVLVFNSEDAFAAAFHGVNITSRTWVVQSKRGKHVYIRVTGPLPQTAYYDHEQEAMVLEVRSEGAYVVAHGSRHPDGPLYERLSSPEGIMEIADFQTFLNGVLMRAERRGYKLTLRGQAVDGYRRAEPLPHVISGGARNNTLASLAGSMRRRGASVEAMEAALQAENESRCDPPLPEKEVRRIAESVGRYEPLNDAEEDEAAGAVVRGKTKERLRAIMHEAEYLRTPEGELYARVPIDGRRELLRLGGRGDARSWLIRRFDQEWGTSPPSKAVSETVDAMEARARFDGTVREIHTRLAYVDGAMYLDLANDAGQVVRIAGGRWEIATDPPVLFRRPPAMRPLPLPVSGGTLDELKRFVRVDAQDWPTLIGALVSMLHPRGPYPSLILHGEQGSAKSSSTRYLRMLIDPNLALTRRLTDDARDLAVQTRNNWIIACDNVSTISDEQSDLLCQVSTGSGFGTRSLYTDDQEAVFHGRRPVIINAITEVGLRGDFVDRAIRIRCLPFNEWERLPETTVDALFAETHPRLLGALLDVVAYALENHTKVEKLKLPRMADLAQWVTAAEPALNWPAGTFLKAYGDNRKDAQDLVLEYSPIGAPLLAWLESHRVDKEPLKVLPLRAPWKGTARQLLDCLNNYIRPQTASGDASESPRFTHDERRWPKDPTRLAGELARLKPALRAHGWKVDGPRKSHGSRLIEITYFGVAEGDTAVTQETPAQASESPVFGAGELETAPRGTLGTLALTYSEPLKTGEGEKGVKSKENSAPSAPWPPQRSPSRLPRS